MRHWQHLDSRLAPYGETRNHDRACVAMRQDKPPAVRTRSPGLSVAILNLDKPELIVPLARALVAAAEGFEARGLGLQILIGDTGSRDAAVRAFYDEAADRVEVIRDLRYQFSRCNNVLFFEHARHDTVLFLNNDVVLREGVAPLFAMLEALAATPEAGIAGLVMQFADATTLQHGGIDFFRDGAFQGLPHHPDAGTRRALDFFPPVSSVPAVTGACLMIRSSLFEAIGGFEEGYEAECQDVDLCLKARRTGLSTLLIQAGTVLHLENATRPKGEENWADRRLFMRRWSAFVEAML